jgi:hypothetical protein
MKKYEQYVSKLNMDSCEDLLKDYKYKIGDYIKIHGDILEIIAIDTDDPKNPYYISSSFDSYWTDSYYFDLVPDYEVDAIKYNM